MYNKEKVKELFRQLLFYHIPEELFEDKRYDRFRKSISEKLNFEDFLNYIGINAELYEGYKRMTLPKQLRLLNAIADVFCLAYFDYKDEIIDNIITNKNTRDFNKTLEMFVQYMMRGKIKFSKNKYVVVSNELNIYVPEQLESAMSSIIYSIFYKINNISLSKIFLDEQFKNNTISAEKFIRGNLNMEEQKYLYTALGTEEPLGTFLKYKVDVDYLANLDLIAITDKYGMSYRLQSIQNDNNVSIELPSKSLLELIRLGSLDNLEIVDNKFILEGKELTFDENGVY